MKIQRLFLENGKDAGIFYCGKCRLVYREAAKATQCCVDYKCECGAPRDRKPYIYCQDCRAERERAKEQALFDKAETVNYHNTHVLAQVFDYGCGGPQDGFFSTMEELLDWYEDANFEAVDDEIVGPPEYVFACTTVDYRLDIDQAIENMTENGYEDMYDNLVMSDELNKGLDHYHEINKQALTGYEIDYTRKIKVPGCSAPGAQTTEDMQP